MRPPTRPFASKTHIDEAFTDEVSTASRQAAYAPDQPAPTTANEQCLGRSASAAERAASAAATPRSGRQRALKEAWSAAASMYSSEAEAEAAEAEAEAAAAEAEGSPERDFFFAEAFVVNRFGRRV